MAVTIAHHVYPLVTVGSWKWHTAPLSRSTVAPRHFYNEMAGFETIYRPDLRKYG